MSSSGIDGMIAGGRTYTSPVRQRVEATLGVLLVPVVGVAIGVWAEFDDLGQGPLVAIATPAILVSTVSAAYLLGATRLLAFVALGALAGLSIFTLAEGLYLALHYALGGTLDVEGYDSQAAMAAVLFGVHVVVGTVLGFLCGVAVALVAAASRAFGWRWAPPDAS
jgi:hypothetical protein